MNDERVANVSRLILLGRIDGLSLIERLAANIAVPSAVVDEIRAAGVQEKMGAALAHGEHRRRNMS